MKKRLKRHHFAWPFTIRKNIAVLLCSAAVFTSLIGAALYISPTRAAGEIPGTQPYYDARLADAREAVNWLPAGQPCKNSALAGATTALAGPWKLDLVYTGTGACSAPWDGSSAAPTTTVYGGAYNAASNPYQVTTGAQYYWCVTNRQSFRLVNDIDLGGYLGRNWVMPSNAWYSAWTADGNGHTVWNYYMNTIGTYQAMFGTCSGATIKNMRFSNAYAYSLSGNPAGLGLLTVQADSLIITGCAIEDSLLHANNQVVAGFAAFTGTNTWIDNCYTNNLQVVDFGNDNNSCSAQFVCAGGPVAVTNSFAVNGSVVGNRGHNGAFVSCTNDTTIENCFSNVDIYGNTNSAPFTGVLHDGTHIIKNAYCSGKVEGTNGLGGFIGTMCTKGETTATFENCYTASPVGVMVDSSNIGGFMGAYHDVVWSTQGYNYPPNLNFDSCYAIGEVGSLDINVSPTRPLSTSGGFVGNTTMYNTGTKTYTRCFYDKQTTAMREWTAGNSRDFSGVTGVLTTDTAKAGMGLTNANFNTKFANPADWVMEPEHAPQLKVFADAATIEKYFSNTNWMSREDLTNLIQAYSRASASTVQLETWETDYENKPLTDPTTYDTVRDIVLNFDMTYSPGTAWRRTGNGITLANGSGNTTNINGQNVPVLRVIPESGEWGAHYRSRDLQPGVEWLRVNTKVGDQIGTRALRVVPTSGITAGANASVQRDVDTYDHRNGVRLSYSTGMDMAAERPINEIVFKKSPSDYAGTTTDFVDIDVPSKLKLDRPPSGGTSPASTLHMRASPVIGYDGNAEPILGQPLTLINTATDPLSMQFNGEIPVELTGRYMVEYFWVMPDGRYMHDQKMLNILFDPELDKNAYLNDDTTARNGEDIPVSVTMDDEITYELTLRAPEDALLPQYDIVFMLDWSASMADSMLYGKDGTQEFARLYAKDIIMDMSSDIFERYPGSRIALMGLNSYLSPWGNNQDNPATVYLQYDTDFVGPADYNSVIEAAFDQDPAYPNDDNAQFLAAAIDKLNGSTSTAYGTANPAIDPEKKHVIPRLDKSRTPVIVMISDFQMFELDTYAASPADPADYWTKSMKREAQRFYDTFGGECVLLTVRTDHEGNDNRGWLSGSPVWNDDTYYGDLMRDNVILDDQWDFAYIPKGTPYLDALERITQMLDNKISMPASIVDYLPEGLKYLSHTDSTGSAVFVNTGQKCAWNWLNVPEGETKVTVTAKVTVPYVLYPNQARINIGSMLPIYSNVTRHAYELKDPVKDAYVSVDQGVTWQPKNNGSSEAPVIVKPGDWIKYVLQVNSAALPLPLRVQDDRLFHEPTSASGLYTSSYLLLTKSSNAAGGKTDSGKAVTYSINVKNLGESDASGIGPEGVIVYDELPPGMNFVDGSVKINGMDAGAKGTYDLSTRTIRVELGCVKGTGSLSSDCLNEYEITFDVTVNGDEIAEDLKYTNQARAIYRDRGHENEASKDEVSCSNIDAIELERKQAGAVKDPVPDGLIYKDHTVGGAAAFVCSEGSCTWTWEDMPAGTTEISVTVEAEKARWLYDNQAFVKIHGLEDKETNHTYHRALYKLHIRQIVIDPLTGLQRPVMGYYTLTNDGQALPLTSDSLTPGFPFTGYTLIAGSNPVYKLADIVPQYYAFVGHMQNDGNKELPDPDGHPVAGPLTDPPVNLSTANGKIALDYTNTGEIWITVYITPEGKPGENQVTVETNRFGMVYQAETPPGDGTDEPDPLPDDPFSNKKPLYFISKGDSKTFTQLYFIQDVGDGAGELIEIGGPVKFVYNAMGFHTKSMRLYAMNGSTSQLLQIGQGGAVTQVGTIANVTKSSSPFNAGCFGEGTYEDILFLRTGDASELKYVWLANVATMKATRLTLDTSIPNSADLFFMQGYLWTMDSYNSTNPCIFRINPATGAVNTFLLTGLGITKQQYGGQWKYSNEDFGISGNTTGDIYRIHIENAASAAPKFTLVSKITGPAATGNDAASYIGLTDDTTYG